MRRRRPHIRKTGNKSASPRNDHNIRKIYNTRAGRHMRRKKRLPTARPSGTKCAPLSRARQKIPGRNSPAEYPAFAALKITPLISAECPAGKSASERAEAHGSQDFGPFQGRAIPPVLISAVFKAYSAKPTYPLLHATTLRPIPPCLKYKGGYRALFCFLTPRFAPSPNPSRL